jgi:hypothetical protein
MNPLKGLLGSLRIQSEGFEFEELPCQRFFSVLSQPSSPSIFYVLTLQGTGKYQGNTINACP